MPRRSRGATGLFLEGTNRPRRQNQKLPKYSGSSVLNGGASDWRFIVISLVKRAVNGVASKVGLRIVYARYYRQLEEALEQAKESLEQAIAQRNAAQELTTGIFAAIARDDPEGVRCAVEAGASVNQKRSDGVTPLSLACSLKSYGAVQELLKLGADPNLPTSENWLPRDFAQNDTELDRLLREANPRQAIKNADGSDVSPIRSLISSDLAEFLDNSELVLPEGGLQYLGKYWREKSGEHSAQEFEHQLSETKYRALFEQLFAAEALACSYLSPDGKAFRSPMAHGMYEVEFGKRRGTDIPERFKRLFGLTDKLLFELLPDDLFPDPPKRICEIGGAWGATIKHLKQRFSPDVYHNYEPDRAYAQWAAERFGVTNMPVDGETLRNTESASIDLVVANNVFIFVPPVKVWSYLREMKRVVRKGGMILFNAVQSDQLSDEDLETFLVAHFPKRTLHILPSDIITRIFPAPKFELLKIHGREYRLYRRVE
jgi:hypothetical protein